VPDTVTLFENLARARNRSRTALIIALCISAISYPVRAQNENGAADNSSNNTNFVNTMNDERDKSIPNASGGANDNAHGNATTTAPPDKGNSAPTPQAACPSGSVGPDGSCSKPH